MQKNSGQFCAASNAQFRNIDLYIGTSGPFWEIESSCDYFNCAICTFIFRPFPVYWTKGSCLYFAAALAALWACGLGRGLIRWPFTNLLGSSVSPSLICCKAALTVSCGVPCSVFLSGIVPVMTSTGTSSDLPGPDGFATSWSTKWRKVEQPTAETLRGNFGNIRDACQIVLILF